MRGVSAAEERLAYFDCATGASAEMLLGSLVSAGLLEADLRDLLAPLQRAGAAFDLRVREVAKGPVRALELRIVDQVPNVKAKFSDMLTLISDARVGYGAGVRDLPRPHVMRCFLGYGSIRGGPITRRE